MNTLTRGHRKGGMVAHLLHSADAPSVCGRLMAYVPGGEGLRLCKTCARITGVQMDIDSREFPELPTYEWNELETAFIKGANDSFSLGMCREVLAQYESNPEDYATPHMTRHVAMMRAALSLHTGRDYRDPVDSVAPSMDNGNRNGGMVNPNSKSVARGILTDNQRAALIKMDNFHSALTRQCRELEGKECPELPELTDEWFATLTTRKLINMAFDTLSKGIDNLKAKRDELKRNAPKTAPKLPSASLTVGLGDICKYEGDYYKVKVSQVGNPYAMKWDGASWDYESAKGVIRKLTPEHLATAEDASQFGHMFHRCVFCSRPLARDESETVGYGPDCAEKRGLPWG